MGQKDYEECQDLNNPGWREIHKYNKNKKGNKMDVEKMLRDATDHANYATWQGSLSTLQDLTKHVESICKDHEPPFVAIEIMKYILAECKRYDELMKTTETGKTLNKAKGI